ncbi:MAG: hypothetical protein U1E76_25605 [Planctomycetota bacterium]
MLLSDAGLINNMPVHAAKALGAEVIIAVNLSAHIEEMSQFGTGIEVVFRNEEIGAKIKNDLKAETADVVIEPNLAQRTASTSTTSTASSRPASRPRSRARTSSSGKAKEMKFELGGRTR